MIAYMSLAVGLAPHVTCLSLKTLIHIPTGSWGVILRTRMGWASGIRLVREDPLSDLFALVSTVLVTVMNHSLTKPYN